LGSKRVVTIAASAFLGGRERQHGHHSVLLIPPMEDDLVEKKNEKRVQKGKLKGLQGFLG